MPSYPTTPTQATEAPPPWDADTTTIESYPHLVRLKPHTEFLKAAFDGNLENLRAWGDALALAKHVSRVQLDHMETFLAALENYLEESANWLELHQLFLQQYEGDVADVPETWEFTAEEHVGGIQRVSTERIFLQKRDFDIALRNAEQVLKDANDAVNEAVAATEPVAKPECMMSGANDGGGLDYQDYTDNYLVLHSVPAANFEKMMELRDISGRGGVNPQLRARRDALDYVARVKNWLWEIEAGVRPGIWGDNIPYVLPGDDLHETILSYRQEFDQFKEAKLSGRELLEDAVATQAKPYSGVSLVASIFRHVMS